MVNDGDSSDRRGERYTERTMLPRVNRITLLGGPLDGNIFEQVGMLPVQKIFSLNGDTLVHNVSRPGPDESLVKDEDMVLVYGDPVVGYAIWYCYLFSTNGAEYKRSMASRG